MVLKERREERGAVVVVLKERRKERGAVVVVERRF